MTNRLQQIQDEEYRLCAEADLIKFKKNDHVDRIVVRAKLRGERIHRHWCQQIDQLTNELLPEPPITETNTISIKIKWRGNTRHRFRLNDCARQLFAFVYSSGIVADLLETTPPPLTETTIIIIRDAMGTVRCNLEDCIHKTVGDLVGKHDIVLLICTEESTQHIIDLCD